jgi:hypothetical protein
MWIAAAVVSVTAQPTSAQELPGEFLAPLGDCNMVVEVAVESQNLTYKVGGGETTSTATLHTHIDFANLDHRCPTQGQFLFEVNFFSCRDATGQEASPLDIEGEVRGEIRQGFSTYELPVAHNASESYDCDFYPTMIFDLDNGERRQMFFPLVSAFGINKSGVEVQSLFDTDQGARPQPLGALTGLGLRYEVQTDRDKDYHLSFPTLATPALSSSAWHIPSSQNGDACREPVLDELVACSSDQSPICGCDGRVWSGPCAATRAGIVIRSSSPNHPTCQKSLYTSRRGSSMELDAPFMGRLNVDPGSDWMCVEQMVEQYDYYGQLVDGVITEGGLIRVNQRQPRHLVPWYARFKHGQRNVTHTSGVIRQDLHSTPEICDDQDYRMRSCATTDPCCGQHPDECDVSQSTLSWCLLAGDQDCDGLSDEAETTSDADRVDTDGDGLWDADEVELGLDARNPDTDGDGLSDGEEWQRGLDPLLIDTDNDALPDDEDPFPDRVDHDRDGVADVLDPFPGMPDGDFDGLLDGIDEMPGEADQDGDGLVDGAEVLFGFDPTDPTDAMLHGEDSDGDGLNDIYEAMIQSNPDSVDTDLDGLSDLQDVMAGCSPLLIDTDSDGLTDADELRRTFTNPTQPDTDGDGLNDRVEVEDTLSSPWRADTDRDGLTDAFEVLRTGTSPSRRDTDGGGLDDLIEWHAAGDPHDASDDAMQIRERRVQPSDAPRAVFYRGEGEPTISIEPVVFDQDSGTELLSARAVSMPYHQTTFQYKVRLSPSSSISTMGMQLKVSADNFDVDRVNRIPLQSNNSSTLSQFVWSEAEGTRKILFTVHLMYLVTDHSTGATNLLNTLSSPDLSQDMEGGADIFIQGRFSDDSYDEQDIITALISTRAEVIQRTDDELCDNQIDDDFDGQVDCMDRDCAEECLPAVEICNNGFDDDFDGLIDCMDQDCIMECADFEVCDDFIDNDGDGLVDLADPYCENFCGEFGCGPRPEPEVCNDFIDNDFNGLTDQFDPACQLENCEDGIDNDGDGFTDCLDDKCAMDFFCCDLEDNCGGEICNDGFDNDFDGLVDCDDDECQTTSACIIPGIPPRRSLRDRISDGCGCSSVTTQPTDGDMPRELLVVGVLGLCGLLRRRQGL